MATSHKRDTKARLHLRAPVVAGPLAALATASAVSWGVMSADIDSSAAGLLAATPPTTADASITADLVDERRVSLSRGSDRGGIRLTEGELIMQPSAVAKAIKKADTKRWTTSDLSLWTLPGGQADKVGVLEAGKRVLLTGREAFGRQEIVVNKKQTRWVTAGHMSVDEPFTLTGDCTNGSSVPAGVSENIKKIHAAVCHNFPEITTYGTFRSDGDHGRGIAVDIMVTGDRGHQVAEFIRANYGEFNVNYVIYYQRIWMVARAGEGWRGMADRGSPTANHYDHVHVSVYS